MRLFSIIGSLVVLVCVVCVSYSHTYALMVSVGFHGVFGHMAVVAFEALFLVSVTNIIFARVRGVRPGTPLYMGSMLGVGIVFWGNVRAGLAYGISGAIIGGLIPVCLVVGESILAFSLITTRAQERTQADAHTAAQPSAHTAALTQHAHTAERTQEDAHTAAQGRGDTQEAARTQEGARDPYQVAEQYRAEHGELPSIRQLAKMVPGCSEYRARKVLSELRAVPTIRAARGR